MAVGRREEARSLLLSHGWVISQLFAETPATEQQMHDFITLGFAGEDSRAKEPRHAEVDEKVAKFLRTGKIVSD